MQTISAREIIKHPQGPPTPPTLLSVINKDQSVYLRVESDGTVTGELVEKYPEAGPALTELVQRMVSAFRG